MEPFWPSSGRPRAARRRWRGELSPMAKLFVPRPEYDDPRYLRPDLLPWPDEVEIAQEKAQQWAGHWFEPNEVSAWLHEWPNAVPSVAAGFRDAGVEPATAMAPLWYGKVRPNHRPLAIRVSCGDLSIEEAINQLRAAGMAA
jgi:hypothetical protein